MQSFPRDDKTPIVETFSPPVEKFCEKILSKTPAPKQSDFCHSEVDVYSKQCTEVLENLDTLEEEECNDDIFERSNLSLVNGSNEEKKDTLKLKPLDLKEHNFEMKKEQQKLTTPGKQNFYFNT